MLLLNLSTFLPRHCQVMMRCLSSKIAMGYNHREIAARTVMPVHQMSVLSRPESCLWCAVCWYGPSTPVLMFSMCVAVREELFSYIIQSLILEQRFHISIGHDVLHCLVHVRGFLSILKSPWLLLKLMMNMSNMLIWCNRSQAGLGPGLWWGVNDLDCDCYQLSRRPVSRHSTKHVPCSLLRYPTQAHNTTLTVAFPNFLG